MSPASSGAVATLAGHHQPASHSQGASQSVCWTHRVRAGEFLSDVCADVTPYVTRACVLLAAVCVCVRSCCVAAGPSWSQDRPASPPHHRDQGRSHPGPEGTLRRHPGRRRTAGSSSSSSGRRRSSAVRRQQQKGRCSGSGGWQQGWRQQGRWEEGAGGACGCVAAGAAGWGDCQGLEAP